MANSRQYFGIENLNLTNPQRNTLVTGLQALGVNNQSQYPSERNHWAIRPDNQAVIFEAVFDENTLTIAAIKQRLAGIFGVAVGTISHTSTQSAYGLVVTFTHSAQQKLRIIAFGHNGAAWGTYQESQSVAQQYLIDNAAAWG